MSHPRYTSQTFRNMNKEPDLLRKCTDLHAIRIQHEPTQLPFTFCNAHVRIKSGNTNFWKHRTRYWNVKSLAYRDSLNNQHPIGRNGPIGPCMISPVRTWVWNVCSIIIQIPTRTVSKSIFWGNCGCRFLRRLCACWIVLWLGGSLSTEFLR